MTIIAFDLDGTLIDSERPFLTGLYNVYQPYLPDQITRDDFNSWVTQPELSGVSSKHRTHALDKTYNTCAMNHLPQIEASARVLKREVHQDSQVFDGVFDCLEEIKANNDALALVSTNNKDVVLKTLAAKGLDQYFDPDHIFVPNRHRSIRPKPEPDTLYECAKVMESHGSILCYVGDSQSDYGAAKAAGIKPVIFTGGYSNPQVFKNYFNGISIQSSEEPALEYVDTYTNLFGMISKLKATIM